MTDDDKKTDTARTRVGNYRQRHNWKRTIIYIYIYYITYSYSINSIAYLLLNQTT